MLEKENTQYMSYEVRMNYQAGYDQLREWPGGGKTVHAGIGWFHPFGKSHYYCVIEGCKEQEAFPVDKYFSDYWIKTYDLATFCIYRLDDGDIYAYDGIFCRRGEGGDEELPDDTVLIRRDILTNVIVGGTGRYEGAVGLMTGTAEGNGKTRKFDEELTLPEALIKNLTGYLKIPIKK